MFVTNDDKKIKWYWIDGKMHDISVKENEESNINLKELNETCAKIIKDNLDKCKDIYFLGIALTGTSEGGWGFLMGWLVRSIKKDQEWNIVHNEETLDNNEVIDHLANIMEESAKNLREHKDGNLPLQSVTPTLGSNNGTDLFK
jgi:hypothetical protein